MQIKQIYIFVSWCIVVITILGDFVVHVEGLGYREGEFA